MITITKADGSIYKVVSSELSKQLAFDKENLKVLGNGITEDGIPYSFSASNPDTQKMIDDIVSQY